MTQSEPLDIALDRMIDFLVEVVLHSPWGLTEAIPEDKADLPECDPGWIAAQRRAEERDPEEDDEDDEDGEDYDFGSDGERTR